MSAQNRVAALEAAEAGRLRAGAPSHWRAAWAGYTDAELLALRGLLGRGEALTPAERAAGRRYASERLVDLRSASALVEAGRLVVEGGTLGGGPWSDAERRLVERVADTLTNWSDEAGAVVPTDTHALGAWLALAVESIERDAAALT